jgi:hypothetical protein
MSSLLNPRRVSKKLHITNSTSSKALLLERTAQVVKLTQDVQQLETDLAKVYAKLNAKQRKPLKKKHNLVAYSHVINSTKEAEHDKRISLTKRPQVSSSERSKLGRNASIATAHALALISPEADDAQLPWIKSKSGQLEVQGITTRIQAMFKDPSHRNHLKYLKSHSFASDIIKLNHYVKRMMEEEPRVAFVQSPAYVFGDIHGNLEDLHFFADNIWRLGMSLTAGNFVFLGDYVDRGRNCLEVVAYLLTMKILFPYKVTLLRGNHETRDVNGWEEHYGNRSFIHQCEERFGEDVGYKVWESTNQVFDRMPLAAVIDQDIFCVHGGIPRPVESNDVNTSVEDLHGDDGDSTSGPSRIQDILGVSKVAGINPPYEHEEDQYQQVASDCIWSDPASDEQEMNSVDEETGFGESLRGGGAICFGSKAVSDFLEQQGYSYIMRAHEAHAEGVAVSKGARVFTVFSTSKDHNQGDSAMAGCILVDNEKLQVINRSPAYKNQYIHRRDSVSLHTLSEKEIAQRIKLGLINEDIMAEDEEEEEEYHEQWDEIQEQEGEEEEEEHVEEYRLDTRRSSTVESWKTCASPVNGSHDNHTRFDSTATNGRLGGTQHVAPMDILEEDGEESSNANDLSHDSSMQDDPSWVGENNNVGSSSKR